jgi:DNA topoisomerase II
MSRLYRCLTRIYCTLQLSQIEHILKRPDSYIGSVETITQVMWTFDSDTKRMVNREVKYVPGFFKIVDEILVNAADNKVYLHCS